MNHPDYRDMPQQAPFGDTVLGQGSLGLGPPVAYERTAEISPSERAEMERIKAGYLKQARADEMVELSRTLEHVRQRLTRIDLQNNASVVNGVIHSLINLWNEERALDCQ